MRNTSRKVISEKRDIREKLPQNEKKCPKMGNIREKLLQNEEYLEINYLKTGKT